MSDLAYQPGTYRVRVTRWQLGKTKNNHPQFVLSFVPLGLLSPNDPEAGLKACADFERSIFRVITDNSIDFVVQDLRRLGYDREDFSGLNPDAPGAFNFRDIELDARCQHRMWEGKTKEDWSFAWGGGGFEVEPLDTSEVAKLNALFGKKLKTGAAQATSRPVPANTAATAQTDFAAPGEDIPF